METSREVLLAALMKPESYPHEVGHIERIDTHISTVLLTGAYAYKIKKPLNLGFLDFTTLAARRHFCEEELRLNRRLAPSLYLDVIAICGKPDSPRLGSRGAEGAIEYAVKMKQFPQQGLLDRMLVNGELTRQHVDALAHIISDFHAKAGRTVEGDRYGAPAGMEALMRQNFAQIRELPISVQDRDELDEIERWSVNEHVALTPLMALRQRHGRVRECHGDLHLGNIALVDGEVQVFDCIEFNADLRWTDVAAEVAFLIMDFTARGRPDLGVRFLNAYLEISGDYEAVRLLPYYLVYRAMVRAKVACIHCHQTGLSTRQREALRAEFSSHLQLARTFTARRQPCLIITHGVSGSGKTTVTQPLVEHLGALRLRSDLERKRLHGLDAMAHSGSAVGAGLYAETVTQATYNELHRLARLLIDCCWPVIVDAAFLKRKQRDRFRALAAETKVPFFLLECHAAPDELRRRVAQRAAAGTDASEATLAVLEMQLAGAEPLVAEERSNALVIDTCCDDAQSIINLLPSTLRSPMA
ncbi:Aminoglycoside phosphotransferase [Georgfuchsia toluolica]|uniref:Aminoglycoside phosphotransferase n=1 Tax=Georgfuchsia toluolica TaxID=424218 RepID=A0A916MZQ4_9PROT|nr:bifunctional aminoglycoside phosphotransferase/ATP-binding protein [Georgfuchsia toluolica]CAG4883163.1 Aminoglycoside phosphotransferase [Georgfuchsia toluolica]